MAHLITDVTATDACFVHVLDDAECSLTLAGATPPFDAHVGQATDRPLRERASASGTLVPGQAPELQITPGNDSFSITAGHKRYVLPAEDVTVLPLANTTLEAIAGYLLGQVLPQLQKAGLVAAELAVAEPPGTSATARVDLT